MKYNFKKVKSKKYININSFLQHVVYIMSGARGSGPPTPPTQRTVTSLRQGLIML
jgi:hypothetical protein